MKPVDRQLMNPDVPTKEVDNLCNLNNYATAALELEEQISAPYLIQCAQDYYGGDLYHKQVYDGLVGCIDLCDQVESCHLVSFSKGFDGTGLGDCYLKSAQGVQVRNTTLDSARKMDPESTSPAVVVKIEGTRTAMMRKKRPHDENHGAVSTATQSAVSTYSWSLSETHGSFSNSSKVSTAGARHSEYIGL